MMINNQDTRNNDQTITNFLIIKQELITEIGALK